MAVYTPLSEADIAAHLAQYDLGALMSFTGISEGVENTNYRIDTERGVFILTLFEKRVDAESLPFYLSFMRALHDTGLPTAEIVRTRDGHDTVLLRGKAALVSRFLNGSWPRTPTAADTAAIGTLLGRMHATGMLLRQQRRNTMGVEAWISLIHACGARADDLQPGLEGELEQALGRIQTDVPRGLPDGVIHADLFPDNVFFEDGAITGVIDFWFACRDTLVYDLMLTFNAWCFTPFGDIDIDRARAFITAYHAARPLTDNEIASLSFFGMAAALRIISTRLYDYLHPVPGALVRPKDPLEHMHILRYHRAVSDAGAGYDWWPL